MNVRVENEATKFKSFPFDRIGGSTRPIFCMKKFVVLLLVVAGLAFVAEPAARAGVHFSFGFPIPVPFVYGPGFYGPGPYYYYGAPYYGAPYYGYGYGGYYYRPYWRHRYYDGRYYGHPYYGHWHH
jgi:hypothetical protein